MHILIKCIHIENISDASSVNIGKSLNIVARVFEPGTKKKPGIDLPSFENIQNPTPVIPVRPSTPAEPSVPPAVVR